MPIGNIVVLCAMGFCFILGVIALILIRLDYDVGFYCLIACFVLVLVFAILAIAFKIALPEYFVPPCPSCGALGQCGRFCVCCGYEIDFHCTCGKRLDRNNDYCPFCGKYQE